MRQLVLAFTLSLAWLAGPASAHDPGIPPIWETGYADGVRAGLWGLRNAARPVTGADKATYDAAFSKGFDLGFGLRMAGQLGRGQIDNSHTWNFGSGTAHQPPPNPWLRGLGLDGPNPGRFGIGSGETSDMGDIARQPYERLDLHTGEELNFGGASGAGPVLTK